MELSMLTFAIIIGVGFITALLVGAGIAVLLGYKLNEPEYYEQKDKENDAL
jgi:hypothetical protein